MAPRRPGDCAGMNILGDAVDVGPEDIDRVPSANLRSTYFTSQAAGRVMI